MQPYIVSLSRNSVAAEFATRLVRDAGVEVVKIEPRDGDPLRGSGPLFTYLAAGKRSVVLELSCEAADDRYLRLLAGAGAVVVDDWGRGLLPQALEGVSVVHVGKRDAGSLADGTDEPRESEFLAFHACGLGFLTPRTMPGYPSGAPLCPDARLITLMNGLYGAIGVFAALRAASIGRGAVLASVGLTGTALPLLRREVAAVAYDHVVPHRNERIWKVSPAEVHRCRDGWVFVDVIEDAQWVSLCTFIGRADLAEDDRYATRNARFERAGEICAVLDGFFSHQPKSCWIDAQAQGIPIAPVNSLDDLLSDVQLDARGFWGNVEDAGGATLRVPRSPLSRCFGSAERPTLGAPGLGEHSDAIFKALEAA